MKEQTNSHNEVSASTRKTLEKVLNSRLEKARRSIVRLKKFSTHSTEKYGWRIKMCPVCRCVVDRFEPLSDYYRKNISEHGSHLTLDSFETLNHHAYSCPNCHCADRDRLVTVYLQRRFRNGAKASSTLDIAPAPPLIKTLKKFSKAYRSADLYMPEVDDVVDMTDMHVYKNETFDLIICSHVLEHIPDDVKAMREMHRVLQKSGVALVLVPIVKAYKDVDEDVNITDPSERWKRFAQDDHVRLYSQSGLVSRLTTAGFKVELIHSHGILKEMWYDPGITGTSILYVCSK